MKTIARSIVRQHFRDVFEPELEFGHNSADQIRIVAEAVEGIILDSVITRGPNLDAEVSYCFCASLLTDVSIRAARRTSNIQQFLTFANSFITAEKRILLRRCFLTSSEVFRKDVSLWPVLVYVPSSVFLF